MSTYLLTSPNGALALTISLTDGALFYSVEKNHVTVIETSPIGAVMGGADLTTGLICAGEKRGELSG